MTSREILAQGLNILSDGSVEASVENIWKVRIAASLAWQREEMGGIEHVQFAYRNDTPIVPFGHECHPTELIRRGFIDGKGWPEQSDAPKITLSKWPDGNHWYAYVDGEEVIEGDKQKWNTQEQAMDAAKRFCEKTKTT